MADRILRGGRVVDPKNGVDGIADVVIEDGRIAAVTPNYAGHAAEETDCTGLVVCPGLVDSHLHLGSVFGSPYGMRMAALSGVTTCLDMAKRAAAFTPRSSKGSTRRRASAPTSPRATNSASSWKSRSRRAPWA